MRKLLHRLFFGFAFKDGHVDILYDGKVPSLILDGVDIDLDSGKEITESRVMLTKNLAIFTYK